MNKQLLIAAAVLLLLGGGLYMYKAQNSSNQESMMSGGSKNASNESIQGTLKDLAAKGVPMQCAFSNTAETGESSGTVYISGDNMRGDFSVKQPDGTMITSHMIRVDNSTYTWSSNQKQGMKMTISKEDVDAMKKDAEDMMKDEPEQFNVDDQSMNYNCKPWLPNKEFLTPPSDITFTDLSEQLKKVQESVGGSMKAACSACDNAPAGDAREQCKKALGC